MGRTVYFDSNGNEIEPPKADPVPITNADVIRAMTDETMALWLAQSKFSCVDAVLRDLQEQANITVEYPKDETKLTEMILKWLKEEVQDGTL